jgi:hypothetical protein
VDTALPSLRLHRGVTQAILALVLLAFLPLADWAPSHARLLPRSDAGLIEVLSDDSAAGDAAYVATSLCAWSQDDDGDPDDDGAPATRQASLESFLASRLIVAAARLAPGGPRPRAHRATGPPVG